MIWQKGIIAAVLAATGVRAGGIGDLIIEGMTRGNPSYERRMAEVAKRSLVLRGALLEVRQSQGSEAAMNPNGTLNMTLWDGIANSACVEALQALPEASNPSGTCVCYNLPVLNQTQGTFLADLRLYQLGTATGDFAGIPPEKVEVGLRYRGASVSPTSPETAAQKVVGARLDKRQSPAKLNGDLKLLQTYMFIGQIDKEQMKADMSMGELQEFLLPMVTLSGRNSRNEVVSTNVSTTEAAFVAGVFSDEVVMSSFGVAELAVQDEITRLKNGTSAFQLPGVQILIFPIGLIITSIWTVLGLAAYGYGTFCRYNFREQYRRRMLIQQKGAVARF